MKNEILDQMKTMENTIKETLRKDIKTMEESIKKEIAEVKDILNNQRNEIEDLKNRMADVERKIHSEKETYAEVATKEPTIVEGTVNDDDEATTILKQAGCRIGINPIMLDNINRVANIKNVNGYDALRETVKEF